MKLSRRDFLKGMLATTGAAALVGPEVLKPRPKGNLIVADQGPVWTPRHELLSDAHPDIIDDAVIDLNEFIETACANFDPQLLDNLGISRRRYWQIDKPWIGCCGNVLPPPFPPYHPNCRCVFERLVKAQDERIVSVDVNLYADWAHNVGRVRAKIWSEPCQEHLIALMDVTHEILLDPEPEIYAKSLAGFLITGLERAEEARLASWGFSPTERSIHPEAVAKAERLLRLGS